MGRKTNLGAPPSNKEEAILDAALRLFSERGVEGASMNDIAESVGVRKPTLYHYYASKEAIIEAIFAGSKINADWLRGAMANEALPLEARLVAVGERFLEAMRVRPYWQALMIRESLGDASVPWRRNLRDMLDAHIQGRIDALADVLRSENASLGFEDSGLIAGHFFHSIIGFWLLEGHVRDVPPEWDRCRRHIATIAEMVARQVQATSPPGPIEN